MSGDWLPMHGGTEDAVARLTRKYDWERICFTRAKNAYQALAGAQAEYDEARSAWESAEAEYSRERSEQEAAR